MLLPVVLLCERGPSIPATAGHAIAAAAAVAVEAPTQFLGGQCALPYPTHSQGIDERECLICAWAEVGQRRCSGEERRECIADYGPRRVRPDDPILISVRYHLTGERGRRMRRRNPTRAGSEDAGKRIPNSVLKELKQRVAVDAPRSRAQESSGLESLDRLVSRALAD